MKKLLSFIFTIFAAGVFAQSNNPAPYCSADYSVGCAENYIYEVKTTGASTNISNPSNSCGPFANGYSYYCNHYLGVTAGQTISFSVTVMGVQNYGLNVLIDWDGDNAFITPGEQLYFISLSSSIGFPHNFTTTVPPTQPNGTYRMRVRMQQFGGSVPACGPLTKGEVEDYNVYVGIPAPSSVFSMSNIPPTYICVGQTFTPVLNYTSAITPTFSWQGPLSFTSSIANPTITNVVTGNAGNYTVSVTNGSCTVIQKAQLVVYTYPTLTVTSSSDCAGNTQTLTVNGANTYTWSNNWNAWNNPVTPSVTTVYTVTGSNWGCNSTATAQAIILPQYTLSLSSPTICAGQQATLHLTGPSSCTWSTGSNLVTAFDTPSVTTVYTVTMKTGSCTAIDSLTQYVSPCTGVGSNDIENVLSVYPNPTKDKLSVLASYPMEIKLLDITGKEILRQKVNDEIHINWGGGKRGFYFKAEVSINHLPKGIYFVEIVGNSTKPLKLIKD